MSGNRNIRIAFVAGVTVTLALLVFGFVQFRRANATDVEASRIRLQTAGIQERLARGIDESLIKLAAVPAGGDEEATFLSTLKNFAKQSNVALTRWQVAAPNQNNADMKAMPSKQKALLKGITPVIGTLEVQGNYKALLHFTDRLLSAPRLYNVSMLSMSRGEKSADTKLSMTLLRYVEGAPVDEDAPKA